MEDIRKNTLRPNTELFSLNTGKYEPEITPYLDTFHEVTDLIGMADRWVLIEVKEICQPSGTSLVQHFGSSRFLDK